MLWESFLINKKLSQMDAFWSTFLAVLWLLRPYAREIIYNTPKTEIKYWQLFWFIIQFAKQVYCSVFGNCNHWCGKTFGLQTSFLFAAFRATTNLAALQQTCPKLFSAKHKVVTFSIFCLWHEDKFEDVIIFPLNFTHTIPASYFHSCQDTNFPSNP